MQKQQIIEMARVWLTEYGIQELRRGMEVEIDINDLEAFAKLVAKAKAEELATELEKGPLNDTATSIAIWIRSQE